MAENSTPEERTEMPTAKRIEQLRKDGAIAMSNELVIVITLMTGFMTLNMLWSWMLRNFKILLVSAFAQIKNTEALDIGDLIVNFEKTIILMAPPIGILILAVSFAAILSVMLQTDWNIKEKKVEFKFSFLNPMAGVMRIISIQGLVTTLKAIVKLSLILPIAFFALKKLAPEMVKLIHMNVPQIMFFTGAAMAQLFWKVIYILVALAIFDFFWTKFQWLKANKMTKEEVKDERKAVEGDESTKRRIVAKGLQRIAQRIQQSVRQADVVITNPTHYAVALKYDRANMSAPQVVAKGRDHLAQRIKEIAREANVPILERKPLARALYHSVEVGMGIPYELFKAVAEVFAYVYRLKRPYAYTQNSGGR